MQTRRQSLIETAVGVFIGLVTGAIAQALVLPAYGCHVTTNQNIMMVIIFTVISIVRSYFVRRGFNYLHRIQK